MTHLHGDHCYGLGGVLQVVDRAKGEAAAAQGEWLGGRPRLLAKGFVGYPSCNHTLQKISSAYLVALNSQHALHTAHSVDPCAS